MGLSRVNHLFFTIIFILISISTIRGSDDADCVYTAYVRTGSIWKGGTDSIVTLTLYDADGYGLKINNIEEWGGLMGSGYDYFERGNLDIFSGRGPCLTGPVCEMNLTTDGTGSGHGWYCNYVEVTSTGVHMPCAQQNFEVEQWLATDTSPYELTAIRNYCDSTSSNRIGRRHEILQSKSSSMILFLGYRKSTYRARGKPLLRISSMRGTVNAIGLDLIMYKPSLPVKISAIQVSYRDDECTFEILGTKPSI